MNKKKLYNRLIIVTSIAIPVIVAILFRVRIPNVEPLDQLPPIYAGINALTAVFLLIALVAIKQGKRKLHESLMKINILFSLAFLVMYIAYHMTSDPTPYGMVDGVFVASQTSKTIYLVILVSHIILSIVLIPLVLYLDIHLVQNLYRSITGVDSFQRQQRIAWFLNWLLQRPYGP